MQAAARRRSLLRAARLSALVALLAIGVLALVVVVFVVRNLVFVVLGVLGLVVALLGAWSALTRRGPRRSAGLLGAALGLALVLVAVVGASDGAGQSLLRLTVLVALLAVIVVTTRGATVSILRATAAVSVRAANPPCHPVLVCNPKSGGGKVTRFGLVELASSMGVETVLLEPGTDLAELARGALARGADCLGMAGGDGSQALVAAIACEHEVPFVCVAAGTRNHFALDLGLDVDDPRSGLSAFSEGRARRVDFATVNGRLFVNNVSLGVYATIVQDEGYREAKVGTSTALLPELLGRTDRPFDLQFDAPDGREVDGAFLIQVSNNPYVLGPSLDMSHRRRLDSGRLGIVAVAASSGLEAAGVVTRVLARRTAGNGGRRNLFEFTAQEFEVRSRSGAIFAGVDGEALTLSSPLRFTIHPGGLELLVPRGNPQAALRRQARGVDVHQLVSVAFGRAEPG